MDALYYYFIASLGLSFKKAAALRLADLEFAQNLLVEILKDELNHGLASAILTARYLGRSLSRVEVLLLHYRAIQYGNYGVAQMTAYLLKRDLLRTEVYTIVASLLQRGEFHEAQKVCKYHRLDLPTIRPQLNVQTNLRVVGEEQDRDDAELTKLRAVIIGSRKLDRYERELFLFDLLKRCARMKKLRIAREVANELLGMFPMREPWARAFLFIYLPIYFCSISLFLIFEAKVTSLQGTVRTLHHTLFLS